jgi:Prealbumin-like fold domain
MPRSREGGNRRRRQASWWLRAALAVAAAPAAIGLLTAAGEAPSPSPSPSPVALKVVKTDLSGAPLVIPGARFRVHRDTPNGPLLAMELVTDKTGTDTMDVPPGVYCLEEIAAPPGFKVAPTYTPATGCVTAPGTVRAADPPAATPTPSASPSATPTPAPTPSPTPVITGELQVIKADTNGQIVSVPGFTFNIRVGSAKGQVIATINTDSSGTAVAGALNPAVYCVEEVSAGDGYQLAPAYSPSNCASVMPDPTQGDKPTTITVTDPPAPTPTPSDVTGAAGQPSSSPSPGKPSAGPARPASGIPVGLVSKGLIGLGALMLIGGAVMIVVAIRRRRMRRQEAPADFWYDSTIT